MDLTHLGGRVVLAVVLVLLGLLFLLDNLEVLDMGALWSAWWPLLLVALGLWLLRGGVGLFPVLLILVGGILLAEHLGLIPLGGLGRYWPVLLIAAGLWVLLRRGHGGGFVIVRRDRYRGD